MKQIRKMLCVVLTLCLMFSNVSYASEVETVSESKPSISYQTHVQNLGWQDYASDGKTSGTMRKSLRLEGIRIKLMNTPVAGNIEYSTHVQNIGWQNFVSNNQMSGTSGQSLRLEAIQIRLTGEMANQYDVYYRVHSQNFGWLGWAKNGENAGTEGYSYRLEAIEIKLVEKGGGAPGSTDKPYCKKAMAINYRTHVQNQGWQSWKTNGAMSGTSGKALRLEGIQINLSNKEASGDIEYRTHVQNIGWQGWKKNGVMSGTSGKSLRLEAIQIRLTGNLTNLYDVYYRVHAQNFGWLDWAKNGESAGTEGYSFRLEGMEIRLVKKGQAAPGKTQVPFRRLLTKAQREAEAKAEAKRVVNKIINKEMDQMQKAIAICDYLYNNVSLQTDQSTEAYKKNYGNEAYAALILKKAACSGYCKAVTLMCNEAGLESQHINANKWTHQWNLVKIDGKWYVLDAQIGMIVEGTVHPFV